VLGEVQLQVLGEVQLQVLGEVQLQAEQQQVLGEGQLQAEQQQVLGEGQLQAEQQQVLGEGQLQVLGEMQLQVLGEMQLQVLGEMQRLPLPRPKLILLRYQSRAFSAAPWQQWPQLQRHCHLKRLAAQNRQQQQRQTEAREQQEGHLLQQQPLHFHRGLLNPLVRAAGSPAVANLPKLRGAWDPLGFAFHQLTAEKAKRAFKQAGAAQRILQADMMAREAADGSLSLDHVHQTAKRMQGAHIGMLIACGASGVVLGYWNVLSTSLGDVEVQLKQLDERQRAEHGKVVGWSYYLWCCCACMVGMPTVCCIYTSRLP
jgi:hypothetical protein